MFTRWLKILFWAYLLFLVWAASTAINPADPDLWHRLAVGEYLWQHGRFPVGDTFSYLADYQDIGDHEWGSAVIFYVLWSHGGGTAIVLTKIASLALTLGLVIGAGKSKRQPTLLVTAFYPVIMLALLPSFQSTVRCMIFTHLFFALWVYWWQRERRGRVIPTVLYPLSMICWANLHGGFVVGLLWLVLVGVIEDLNGGEWRRWLIRLGWCLPATLVNPYGWHLWWTTGRALLTTRHGFNEWSPVPLFDSPVHYFGYKILLVGTILSLGYAIYRRGWRQIDRPGAVLVAVAVLAFAAARNTSLFAIVAGAVLPGFLRDRSSFSTMDRPLRRLTYLIGGAALAVFPFFAAIATLPGEGLTLSRPGNSCPVAAVRSIVEHDLRGNLLVPFNYGSYALWELRGRMRVSMDGRNDLVYSPETRQRVNEFFSARGDWRTMLTTPAPNAVLVPCDAPVYPKLQAEAGWRELWHDGTDAVFVPAG